MTIGLTTRLTDARDASGRLLHPHIPVTLIYIDDPDYGCEILDVGINLTTVPQQRLSYRDVARLAGDAQAHFLHERAHR